MKSQLERHRDQLRSIGREETDFFICNQCGTHVFAEKCICDKPRSGGPEDPLREKWIHICEALPNPGDVVWAELKGCLIEKHCKMTIREGEGLGHISRWVPWDQFVSVHT